MARKDRLLRKARRIATKIEKLNFKHKTICDEVKRIDYKGDK